MSLEYKLIKSIFFDLTKIPRMVSGILYMFNNYLLLNDRLMSQAPDIRNYENIHRVLSILPLLPHTIHSVLQAASAIHIQSSCRHL